MCDTVLASFDDARGIDVRILDVRKLTDITDYMIVATGTSDRHVKTLADRVLEFMGDKGWNPIGMEGEDSRDWVLVDFVDIVVHIMRDKTRKHYDLEGLWDETFGELGQFRDTSAGITN
jgi:ribosome-associated protein